MRIEITVCAGHPDEPAFAYSHIDYIGAEVADTPDAEVAAHVMDVAAALRQELDRAAASIERQIDRMAQQMQRGDEK